MGILTTIAEWLFVKTTYGIIGIAALIYFAAQAARKLVPAFPNPFAVATLAFVVGACTLPSIPRYRFESQALAEISGKPWIRVINQTKWGSFTEPLTFFKAPIGSMLVVMPNSPIEGGYREILMRYEEETRVSMTEPDCTDKTIFRSEPDKNGVFRYTTLQAQPMTKSELSIYCEYDWSKETEALKAEMRKRTSSK